MKTDRFRSFASLCAVLAGLVFASGAWAQTTQSLFDGRGDIASLSTDAPPFRAPAADPGVDVDQIRERVRLLLSGYEYFPTADDLREVVADPTLYLLELVYGDDTMVVHRHRAIAALGLFPSDESRAHLDYLLASPATPELTRHHVMNALSTGYGEAALPALAPYLSVADLQLQLTAISAIGAIGTETSVTLLQDSLRIEADELVRERIQAQLTSISTPQLR